MREFDISNHPRKNILYYLLIVLVLFLPTTNFYLYYGLVSLATMSVLIFYPISLKKLPVLYSIVFIIVSISFIRVIYFGNNEDIKELVKLVLFFSILIISARLSLTSTLNILLIFVYVNFIIAFLQFNHLNPVGLVSIINKYYVADHHINASLSYSIPRAIGLSSGPGQQAVLNIFIASIFFISLKWLKGNRKKYIFGIILAIVSVILSQSKTVILAAPVGVGIYLLSSVNTIKTSRYLLSIASFIFFIIIVLFFKDYIIIKIPELSRVLSSGLSVSSFQDRLYNWYIVTEPVLRENSLMSLFFGIGRSGLEYFSINDIPYDSDYIYMLVNFGLIGLIAFICFNLYFIIIRFSSAYSTPRRHLFSLICSLAVINSLSLNFYIEPRVYILTAIFLSCYNLMVINYERKKN